MKIGVIGVGYVGLATGACLADVGNHVICVDIDKKKIEHLKKGIMPIYEPGLREVVDRNKKNKRLSFTVNLKDAVQKSDIIFICVNTPAKENGEPDLCYVETVSRQIAEVLSGYKLIVEKSTVPVQTGKKIKETIDLVGEGKLDFDVASNPEFLREGKAIADFINPDRIVLGVDSQKAKDLLLKLYKPFKAPLIVTDLNSAELIKHASNSFLALKISFINAVSQICDKVGADVVRVAEGMGYDKRIQRGFLDAGIGFGGSCFPKDLRAFIKMAEKNGIDFRLLKDVIEINNRQMESFLRKIEEALWNTKGKTVGVLGLSFKPNTDDMRNAPSIDVINVIQKNGARVKAFDPQATKKARPLFKDVIFCKDAYQAAKDSDCLVVITEWSEFKDLNMGRIKKLMKNPIIIDGRNLFDPPQLRRMGFRYIGMGRI